MKIQASELDFSLPGKISECAEYPKNPSAAVSALRLKPALRLLGHSIS